MPRIYVEFNRLNQIQIEIETIYKKVEMIRSSFQRTVNQLDWDVKYKADINSTARKITQNLSSYTQAFKGYRRFIQETSSQYTQLDNAKFNANLLGDSTFSKFKKELKKEYGVGDALAGAGYIGTIYDIFQDIKNVKSPKDVFPILNRCWHFGKDAKQTFLNYKKIGNAVGNQKAMTWWAKNVTGIKPLGRYSTAKKPVTRFFNNLTNKTSPFNAQIKNAAGNFAGSNGVGAAIASWGAVAINGILNWHSNKEEQANSNGEMSDGRVIAETITETAIDTGLTIGATAIAGAAVTAIFPMVSAGVAVVAASGLIVAGINAGVKAIAGKSFTEWASDTILDSMEAAGTKIGASVKAATNAIGSWFWKLSPA